MKKFLLPLVAMLSLTTSTIVCGQQWVHIPDPNFKAALLNQFSFDPTTDLSPYFYGDSLDVSAQAVQEIVVMDVYSQGITDLTGVSHFLGLIELDCSNNPLTELPSLPASLQVLDCNFNQLQSLPSLPASLTSLVCLSNQIQSLPALPSSLEQLYCDDNGLQSLPALPPSLIELACSSNQLVSLPTLPPSLEHLICWNNQLQSLPPLPVSLVGLYCQDNVLQCLPMLPIGLSGLNISNNNISCIPNMPPEVTTGLFEGLPICSFNNIYGCDWLTEVTGHIYFDANDNCAYDGGEVDLAGRIVESSDGSYAISDSSGMYSLYVGPGEHTITQSLPSNSLWDITCPNVPYTVVVDSLTDSIPDINFPNHANEVCSWLTISLSSWAQRPCFTTNSYHLSYCNVGTATAIGAYIDVELPIEVTPLYGSMTWTDLGNGTIRFDLGDVGIGECGNISFTNSVDCNAPIGHTICARAEIFPHSSCFEAAPGWDGSSIMVSAECAGGENVFTIANEGAGNMNAPLNYRIYRQEALYLSDTPFQLNSGQSIEVPVPADGLTYLLSAQQSVGHAGSSTPQAWIEGCESPIQLSAIWFDQNDQDDHVDIECNVLTASYDPNDKTVVPAGYGSEHNISMTDTLLEYRIRFQNTGSDTAFNIVVVDTLPLQALDITTFESGASSHPYWVDIYGEGVVSWHFDDILLPDSNVNEPLSHGFVTFKVNRFADLPEGTVINNSASIYFDFNAPVLTNTSFITLSDDVLMVSVMDAEALISSLYPNPASNTVTVSGLENSSALTIYDMTGRRVHAQMLQAGNTEIDITQFENGTYILRVDNGTKMSVNRLVKMD